MKRCETCGSFFTEPDQRRCPHDGRTLIEVSPRESGREDRLIGQVLGGKYRITGALGRGGMGAVYRAVHSAMGRDVALKVIGRDAGGGLSERFLREAQLTAKLTSPHTVTIHDFGQDPDGTLFLTMELLEGSSLQEALASRGALPWRHALQIVAQVAESLHEAHGKGIVHRDLKPSNIFLVAGDPSEGPRRAPALVKVLDFGVGKVMGERETSDLTDTGQLIGTPTYMAPEQARSEPVDHRADLYALGVVLYEMLSGAPPFGGQGPVSILMKHCQADLPPLSDGGQAEPAPSAAEGLALRLLRKDPSERPSSARAVRDCAEAILAGEDVPWLGDVAEPGEPERSQAALAPTLPRGIVTHPSAIQDGLLPPARRPRLRRRLVGAAAAVAAIASFALWVEGAEVTGFESPGGAVPSHAVAAADPAPAPAPAEISSLPTEAPPPELPPLVEREPTPLALEPAPPAPAKPPPLAYTVTVVAQPGPAVVQTVDGEILGPTPLVLPSPDEALQIELVRDGYQTASATIAAGVAGIATVPMRREPTKRKRPRALPF